MVGAEVVLAVFANAINRGIDYLDSLLSDRYTFFVSVRVMRKAADLDLTTYEDPGLLRPAGTRPRPGDRPAGDDPADGPALPAGRDDRYLYRALIYHSPWLVLLLILGRAARRFSARRTIAFLGYAKNFRQTPGKRQMDYLRQVGGSSEGREGTEALQPERVSHRTDSRRSRSRSTKRMSTSRAAS